MHDAEFGIGMYRYYAGVAPAIFRFLRLLLLLPGGDRAGGLEQLERASQRGLLVRGEAQFQIHVLYLWYEHKSQEALAIVRGLQAALPAQPALPPDRGGDPRRLLPRSRRQPAARRSSCWRSPHRARCSAPTSPTSSRRLNMARQLIALQQRDRAITELDALIAAHPPAPAGALARARADAARRFASAHYRFVARSSRHVLLKV